MINIINIIVTVLFTLAGTAKLLSVKPIKEQFEEFKLPIAMMYLVGTLEVAGAILLHFQPLKLFAAITLMLMMIGAIFNHLKVKHPIDKSIPSIVLLILTTILVYSYI